MFFQWTVLYVLMNMVYSIPDPGKAGKYSMGTTDSSVDFLWV
jgi:hypothetical protein